MSTHVYMPDGMVFALAIGTSPVRLREAMLVAGIKLDLDDPAHNWARTTEIRFQCASAVQFSIIDEDGHYSDEATAPYWTVPADAVHAVPLIDAHDKVYFKAAAPATLYVQLYGAARLAATV